MGADRAQHDNIRKADPSSVNPCDLPGLAPLRDSLAALSLPPGLLSAVATIYRSCDLRLWLLDNSARMKIRDGRVAECGGSGEGGSITCVGDVTRWEELHECVAFHTQLAARCWLPTKSWLVNDPKARDGKWQPSESFCLCWGSQKTLQGEIKNIRKRVSNPGLNQMVCPLACCLKSMAKRLRKQAPEMAKRGRHATLVLVTQGKPTDKHGDTGEKQDAELIRELSDLSQLGSVKIILRLCTDNEEVLDMYNTLDGKLDEFDVLNDFWGESREVYLHNPWLCYSIGLHRLRESGLAPSLMDSLDERPLRYVPSDRTHALPVLE